MNPPGQGVQHITIHPLLYLAHLYATRRRSISLVANAYMASRCGSDCPVVLVLPLVPDFSGESLPVKSGAHPRRSRANGSVNGAISLRAPIPMYAGGLLFFLGSGFLLGSWIGVLLGLLLVGILARRWCGRNASYGWVSKGMMPI